MTDSLCLKTHKKLDESTGLVEFFFTAMLRLIACNIGNKVLDSEGILFQRLGLSLFRDEREDGKLLVSFEGSLSLQLAAKGVQSLLFLASQIQKEHSIEDLLNFFIVLMIIVLLKSSFLKQHKRDLEQYPLAPNSTAKSSTHQPLIRFYDCF